MLVHFGLQLLFLLVVKVGDPLVDELVKVKVILAQKFNGRCLEKAVLVIVVAAAPREQVEIVRVSNESSILGMIEIEF